MPPPAVRVTVLGAAREVTGSMVLVESPRSSVLVDCGMFQGPRAETRQRNARLPPAASSADAVVLTHAHIDHCGSLPTLVRSGWCGAIYATAATRDLAAYMLRDAAHLQEADAEYLNRRHADDPAWSPIVPLYREADAAAAVARMVGVPYHLPVAVTPDITATLLDAGHILGSAQVLLEVAHRDGPRRVLLSGDLGRRGMPIIRDPDPPPGPVELLCLESTYGDRRHAEVERVADELGRVVSEIVERGGKVVVPAFALGRTQELLYFLHDLRRRGRMPSLPVFIDSPLAIDVTSVFRLHPECFDDQTRQLLDQRDPFGFDGLRLTRSRDESLAINEVTGPALIIAASGMAEGGRVLHHLRQLVEDPRNTVLIVGFMAQHTLGRRLVERRPRVKIWGVERELRAQVISLPGLSAHADADDLRRYAAASRARRIVLVHGEAGAQGTLCATLRDDGLAVDTCERGQVFELV